MGSIRQWNVQDMWYIDTLCIFFILYGYIDILLYGIEKIRIESVYGYYENTDSLMRDT